jgi:hypothetical protein
MSASEDYVDQTGGPFDVESLKKTARRWETPTKPRHALAAIERQILEEIASQSGRYGERLDVLLGEMRTLRQAIEQTVALFPSQVRPAAPAIEEVNARIVAYNQLRRQAQQVQHYLIIHREAMGFWHHDDVFRCYPIPTALTPMSTSQSLVPPAGS